MLSNGEAAVPWKQHVYYIELNRETKLLLYTAKLGRCGVWYTASLRRPRYLISVGAVSIGALTSGLKYPRGESYTGHFLHILSTFT